MPYSLSSSFLLSQESSAPIVPVAWRYLKPILSIILLLLCPGCTITEGPDFETRPIPQDFGWSPDGRYFLFVSDYEGEFFPYALDLQDDVLIQLDDRPAFSRPFTFAPDGTQVAFPSPGISGSNITVYDFHQYEAFDIVTDTDLGDNLSWSHDGQQLFYVHESHHELRTYVFATQSVERLLPLPETALRLALAPNDTFLAGILDHTIYLLDLAIGTVTEWQDNSICGTQLNWLPDASAITFQSCREGEKQLAGLEIATGQRLEYELTRFGAGFSPWSPAGDKFLFGGLNPEGGDEIMVWDRLTGTTDQVTSTPDLAVAYPFWSPDGQQIIYWTGTPGIADEGSNLEKLHIINRDGSGQRELLNLYP